MNTREKNLTRCFGTTKPILVRRSYDEVVDILSDDDALMATIVQCQHASSVYSTRTCQQIIEKKIISNEDGTVSFETTNPHPRFQTGKIVYSFDRPCHGASCEGKTISNSKGEDYSENFAVGIHHVPKTSFRRIVQVDATGPFGDDKGYWSNTIQIEAIMMSSPATDEIDIENPTNKWKEQHNETTIAGSTVTPTPSSTTTLINYDETCRRYRHRSPVCLIVLLSFCYFVLPVGVLIGLVGFPVVGLILAICAGSIFSVFLLKYVSIVWQVWYERQIIPNIFEQQDYLQWREQDPFNLRGSQLWKGAGSFQYCTVWYEDSNGIRTFHAPWNRGMEFPTETQRREVDRNSNNTISYHKERNSKRAVNVSTKVRRKKHSPQSRWVSTFVAEPNGEERQKMLVASPAYKALQKQLLLVLNSDEENQRKKSKKKKEWLESFLEHEEERRMIVATMLSKNQMVDVDSTISYVKDGAVNSRLEDFLVKSYCECVKGIGANIDHILLNNDSQVEKEKGDDDTGPVIQNDNSATNIRDDNEDDDDLNYTEEEKFERRIILDKIRLKILNEEELNSNEDTFVNAFLDGFV